MVIVLYIYIFLFNLILIVILLLGVCKYRFIISISKCFCFVVMLDGGLKVFDFEVGMLGDLFLLIFLNIFMYFRNGVFFLKLNFVNFIVFVKKFNFWISMYFMLLFIKFNFYICKFF